MWSKKPMPVAISARPVPSRSSESRMSVSLVVRVTVAVRGMRGAGFVGAELKGCS